MEQNMTSEILHRDARYLGPAQVLEVEGQEVVLGIPSGKTPGRVALPGYHPAPGDMVLAIGEPPGRHYIIGVLESDPSAEGVHLSRDQETGRTRIAVDRGDIEFITADGNMHFIANGEIRMTSTSRVEVQSRLGIGFSVFNRLGQVLTNLKLGSSRASMTAPDLDMEADTLKVASRRTIMKSDTLKAGLRQADVEAERLQVTSDLVISKARNVYRRVTELWQVAAGRTRMVVKGTSHHKAHKVNTKAEEDIKMDAKKIHLG